VRNRPGRTIVGFALALVLTLGGHLAPATAGSVEVFRFQDPSIGESSGVATASYRNDLIFTHNDSGDSARFFAVDFTGHTVATYAVAGAQAVDWEDMARGPHHDGTPGQSLYFADMGNNLRDRSVLTIYEVDEPMVGVTPSTIPIRSTLTFSYPDIPHDAEALLVHPVTGQLVVVAKEFHGFSNVYLLTGGVAVQVTTLNMLGLMTLSLDALIGPSTFTGAFAPLPGTQITGGAIGPAGDRIVLRTYLEAFEWRLYGSDYAGSFAIQPVKVAVPPTSQGESATYTNGGAAFITTTEGVGGPVHRVDSAFAS
jgi:hypothetical protein